MHHDAMGPGSVISGLERAIVVAVERHAERSLANEGHVHFLAARYAEGCSAETALRA
jgi:hypothetical protein